MSQGEEVTPEASKKITGTDFSFQFSAAREYQKVEKKIFNILSTISREEKNLEKKNGILVVFGVFDSAKDYIVSGMRQIGVNPIQKYIDIQFNLEGTGKNKAGQEIAIFKGEFSFDRTKYGMPKDESIANIVKVKITTELIKQ